MEKLHGSVESIVFYNEDNGYCVADIDTGKEVLTVVGNMHCLTPGDSITVMGEYKDHPVYGRQLVVSSFEKAAPTSADSIYKYLSSGMIKGVRESTAKKIVDAFGEDSLEVIEKDPEKLAGIKGISIKKAYEINSEYILQFGMRTLIMFLQQYEISPAYAVKIYKTLGADAISKIKDNPYILSKKIKGIGFKTIDKMAFKMGIDPGSTERIKAAVKYILSEYVGLGNTFYDRKDIILSTRNLLNCGDEIVEEAINLLEYEKEIVIENVCGKNAVYLTPMHIAECNCAYRLRQLNSAYPLPVTDKLREIVEKVESRSDITLDDIQRKAVFTALTYPVTVITGGPGTGKTTVINTIIKSMELLGKKIVLAAPTGRAAKRMSAVTGKEAKTLHRLLELGFSGDDDERTFARDDSNPIDADVIIVDEMSMVDILLLNSLLKAVALKTSLIMVGDADQLPSIGPGNVLRDIINSEGIVTVKLTKIFRQAKESLIVVNAHRINKGISPVFNDKNGDFFFLPRNTADEITETITNLCLERLPRAYGFNPLTDIQVLSPTRKGAVGVNTLNTKLQEVLNPPSSSKSEKKVKDTCFRINDKVMQIRNNYDMPYICDDEDGIGLFNGDIGSVKDIDTEFENMTVLFDETKTVHYPFSSLADLELSYAATIHKSQGSEFAAVIIPLYPAPYSLMSRNLLYTGITRAKKLVILVGQKGVLENMIQNNREVGRCSGLVQRLKYD